MNAHPAHAARDSVDAVLLWLWIVRTRTIRCVLRFRRVWCGLRVRRVLIARISLLRLNVVWLSCIVRV